MSYNWVDALSSTKTAEISDKLKRLELTNEHGYRFLQINGQRIFGPPPFDAQQKMPRGCEIFVGHLPREMYEDELFPLFSSIGEVYKMRLMLDFNGYNRGYAFVSYINKNHAIQAVQQLNGMAVRPNCRIGVYLSVDNCRLFVGGIPLEKTKEEVYRGLRSHVDGIVDVIMCQSREDKTKNRGYVFVEFVDHKMAALARRQLRPCSLSLWDCSLLVDWADPLPQVDPDVMSKVTKLYISNLPVEISSNNLFKELNSVLSPVVLVKCHKIVDFGFLHFLDRKSAEYALRIFQMGVEISGHKINATWARPSEYNKKNRMQEGPQTLCTSLPSKMRSLVYEKLGKKSPIPASSREQIDKLKLNSASSTSSGASSKQLKPNNVDRLLNHRSYSDTLVSNKNLASINNVALKKDNVYEMSSFNGWDVGCQSTTTAPRSDQLEMLNKNVALPIALQKKCETTVGRHCLISPCSNKFDIPNASAPINRQTMFETVPSCSKTAKDQYKFDIPNASAPINRQTMFETVPSCSKTARDQYKDEIKKIPPIGHSLGVAKKEVQTGSGNQQNCLNFVFNDCHDFCQHLNPLPPLCFRNLPALPLYDCDYFKANNKNA